MIIRKGWLDYLDEYLLIFIPARHNISRSWAAILEYIPFLALHKYVSARRVLVYSTQPHGCIY
jgi:hypothetical protein